MNRRYKPLPTRNLFFNPASVTSTDSQVPLIHIIIDDTEAEDDSIL